MTTASDFLPDTVEPRFNEVAREWGNWFLATLVCATRNFSRCYMSLRHVPELRALFAHHVIKLKRALPEFLA